MPLCLKRNCRFRGFTPPSSSDLSSNKRGPDNISIDFRRFNTGECADARFAALLFSIRDLSAAVERNGVKIDTSSADLRSTIATNAAKYILSNTKLHDKIADTNKELYANMLIMKLAAGVLTLLVSGVATLAYAVWIFFQRDSEFQMKLIRVFFPDSDSNFSDSKKL